MRCTSSDPPRRRPLDPLACRALAPDDGDGFSSIADRAEPDSIGRGDGNVRGTTVLKPARLAATTAVRQL